MFKKSSLAALAAGAVVLLLFAPCSTVSAHPDGLSVAINFGADEPPDVRSEVLGPAGLLQTVNWNNLDLATGGPAFVEVDDQGVSSPTSVEVVWTSANTWSSTGRGEENNTAPPGDDRELMTGYLDTNNTAANEVTVSGLDEIVDAEDTYAVYVYMNGGVIGRGGDYTIGAQTETVIDNDPFDGNYVQGENFIVFEGLTEATFTLTGFPTTPAGGTMRAPINAIEIVAGGVVERIVALRSISQEVSAAECAPNGRGPLTVAISLPLEDGDDPGEVISVSDTVLGPLSDADITGGDSVSNVTDGFIQDWLLLGPYSQDTLAVATPGNPGIDNIRLDYLTDGLDVEEDSVQPEDGDEVNTDFFVAASTGLAVIDGTAPGGDPINPGGMPTWLAWQDGDDTIDFIEIYGQVDSVMTYALTYVKVENAIDVDLCVGSDDAVQVLIDGEEIWINDVNRGYGQAGQCQDLVTAPVADPGGTISLSAGVHTVLIKIFQGGGGHGFRFRFLDHATGEAADGISVCTNPDGDTCSEFTPVGATISSDVTRQQLADGISYTVDVLDGAFTFSGTAADNPIEGANAVTLGCDTRVSNVVCVENAAGGIDVTWENHPSADPGVGISVLVNGVEVATAAGDATSATVAEGDLQAGYNQICVVNSSGTPVCCQLVKGGIGLADLVGGGDGTGTADPSIVGLNIDTGAFETDYLFAAVANSGDNPQAVDASAYVDSVFIMDILDFENQMFITSNVVDGPVFPFDALDAFNSWGHIQKDATHDMDKNPPITDIWAGGQSDWASCVAVHAAGGITFNLESLRDDDKDLLDFSCFAGTDQCAGSMLNLYVIFSDAEEVLDSVSVLGQGANMGEEVEMAVPEGAIYLTLAVGAADGGVGCDHGVFANALITTEGGPVVGDTFVRGDADSSGVINITDGIRILSFLFTGGGALECPDAGDTDDDGALTITDAIKVFGYLFLGQGDPSAPSPSNAAYVAGDCGVDPQAETPELGCPTRAGVCNP